MVPNMSPKTTSNRFFSAKQVAAALAAASTHVPDDFDNPRSKHGDWNKAIASYSLDELRAKLGKKQIREP